jgi:hypothetical protein
MFFWRFHSPPKFPLGDLQAWRSAVAVLTPSNRGPHRGLSGRFKNRLDWKGNTILGADRRQVG